MASGDSALESLKIVPTAANAATPDIRAGGSTPGELFEVYDFDASTVEYLDLKIRLRGNATVSGGLTLLLPWGATTATSGNVVWRAAFRRIADDAEDIDGAHTYVYQSVTDAAPSASGEFTDASIAFTSGQIDSIAAGELGILRVSRNASDASDTMSGDAELSADQIALRET